MVRSGSNPVIVHLKFQPQKSSWVNSLNIQTVLLSIQTLCGLGVYADVCDAAAEVMYLMLRLHIYVYMYIYIYMLLHTDNGQHWAEEVWNFFQMLISTHTHSHIQYKHTRHECCQGPNKLAVFLVWNNSYNPSVSVGVRKTKKLREVIKWWSVRSGKDDRGSMWKWMKRVAVKEEGERSERQNSWCVFANWKQRSLVKDLFKSW